MGDTAEHFIEQSDHELNHYKIMLLWEKTNFQTTFIQNHESKDLFWLHGIF